MNIKEVKTPSMTWVNISQVDTEAIAYLKEHYNFHHLDYEDIQGEMQAPKIDTYKNYIFLIVQFPSWNNITKKIITHEVNIFVGSHFLITIHRTKSDEINQFFASRMKSKRVQKQWMNTTTGFCLYKLLESLYKLNRPILNTMGKELAVLEESIFQGKQDINTVKELSIHRRNILHFRRMIDPQRYLIANLSHIRKPFINEETSLYFDDIHDYLNKTWVIINTYEDTVNGLHVTVESLINQKTNKVISTLTIISVGLLPFTVLSSIYGMNIMGLPFAHEPKWVWLMFITLACIVIVLITLMRKKTSI